MRPSVRSAARFCLQLLAIACAASSVFSAEVRVRVLDHAGEPVPDVAIYAEPVEAAGRAVPSATSRPTAAMDQIGSAFVPHILVVESGTEVLFPNSDVVSHHVYSFSETKTFELDLYRGNVHPPQLFDESGLVVVGCNIHDSMLGFILVVDTPHFGKTDADGTVTLPTMAGGTYRIAVWTPRVSERDLPLAREVTIDSSAHREVTFQFTSKLKAPHSADHGSLQWKHY